MISKNIEEMVYSSIGTYHEIQNGTHWLIRFNVAEGVSQGLRNMIANPIADRLREAVGSEPLAEWHRERH